MRTTVAIADELLEAARERARVSGGTLGSVIEAALRRELAVHHESRPAGPELPVFTSGTGPQPGVDLDSTRALSELLDENRDLDALR